VASDKWKVKSKGDEIMSDVKSYRDLQIWQKGIAFVKRIYQETTHFPDTERYGLTNQMRRAAVSIPSNIAEGQARQHTVSFANSYSLRWVQLPKSKRKPSSPRNWVFSPKRFQKACKPMPLNCKK